MPTKANPFPATLTRLREKAGLSKTALALAVGVTRPAVSRLESGDSRPSLDVFVRLADALGVSLDQLAGRKK